MTLTDFLQGKNPKHITSIKLAGQHLTALPPELLQCTNLLKLDLSDNDFATIPKEISSFKRLRVLKIAKNHLKQIHAGILHLKHLKTLDVRYNQILALPKQLSQSAIENLIIAHNQISSIADYTLIANIKKLVLSGNPLIGFCPNCELPKLEYLWLSRSIASNGENVTPHKELLPNLKRCYPQIEFITQIDGSSPMQIKKNKIFISYAHEDVKWLNILNTSLKQLNNTVGGFDIWSDQRILTGDKWKEEIEVALQTSGAAILLLSPSFLASDFIINNELPPILEKAEKQGTHIFIVIVRRCMFEESVLSKYQSVNPLENPLNRCAECDVDDYMVKLMRHINLKLSKDGNIKDISL